MTILHHLDDATVMRYASGDLDEAFAAVVTSHLAMCPECRRAARLAEAVGGELIEACEPASLPAGAFERMMSQIGEIGRPDAPPPKQVARTVAGDVPAPLQRYVGNSLDAIAWRHIAPGVRKHDIALGSKSTGKLYLLNIAPGRAVPEHGHGGSEMTLVLSGAYRDELGRFAAGDIADLDEHVEHQPCVDPDASCICLVATEAPTRFKGVLSRLLQPVFGI
ncbi:MAG: cupin domain-containing protein [Rhodobiaceae bacterium]|nr:cupin domain-containing protein [Rhodobiaceae bacterium]MCC0018173.1 cupin domain-containing protein [Rhodobiaceae bacterium]MCC0051261.1 cupin domain-containing protein [Rhodobiaceae bacterium]MCC0053090.1 cupin domain-containing protein [Rhodobiaceae bacterium]